MKIWEGDKEIIMFHIKYNYFEYQVMLFCLSNALTSFYKYIDKIIVEKLDIFVIVYLDDIIIYTEDSS